MQMFRICAVLAIELLEPRKAAESIAKPRSTTEFREGDFTEVPARYHVAGNQSRPGGVLGGGMQDARCRMGRLAHEAQDLEDVIGIAGPFPGVCRGLGGGLGGGRHYAGNATVVART
jgi:hypothetical protein